MHRFFPGNVAVLTFAGSLAICGCASTPDVPSSGSAILARFSDDSRRLVYEDALYPHFYVYDLVARRPHAFPGRVIAMDSSLERFLVADWYNGDPITITLVTSSDEGPTSQVLPPLELACEGWHQFSKGRGHRARVYPYCHRLGGALNAEAIEVRVCYLGKLGNDRASLYRHVRLSSDQHEWDEVDAGRAPRREEEDQFRPGGLGEPGPACYHVWGSPLRQQVEQHTRGDHSEYVIRSPDGRFVARVCDVDDLWNRFTLTDEENDKDVLLDNTDAGEIVLESTMTIIALPVLLPYECIALMIHRPMS